MGILQDLLIDTESTVEIKGKIISVYPLTLQDLGTLLTTSQQAMSEMFEGKQILPHTHPAFIGNIVALGTRDEDAHKLPAGMQLKLYEKIMEISDVDDAELGKLSMNIAQSAGLMDMVGKELTRQIAAEMSKQPSPNSSRTYRR